MKNIKFSKICSKYTLCFLLLATIFVNIFQNIYSQENANLNTNETKKTNLSELDSNKYVSIDVDKKSKSNTESKDTDSLSSRRVIVEKSIEVVEDDACECAFIATPPNGFPVNALFALGGVAFIPVVMNEFDEEPPSGSTNVVSPSSP